MLTLVFGLGFCCGVRGTAQTVHTEGNAAAADTVRLRAPVRGRTKRFLAGRRLVDGGSAARMLAQARTQHEAMLALPRAANLTAGWTPLGPVQVENPEFGLVTGRVTSLAIDPADASGNTVYLGTTGGGVWKSTNAAGAAGAVVFTPLTDRISVFSQGAGSSATPSLSIGALGIGNGVLLAGTGDPNDATDSYYGSGILRSADGGATWTLAQGSDDGVNGHHSFAGLSVTGFAWSTASPGLVVAALSDAVEGDLVNAPLTDASAKGLYWSFDSGQTWQLATLYDGSQVMESAQANQLGNGGVAATAVAWNPVRQRFYAAMRFHGYYESPDGMTWTRMTAQPGTGLTTANCPTLGKGRGCPIFRGALAVQPVTGDLFALTVDSGNVDQGLWQDACGLTAGHCASPAVQFGSKLNSAALEVGSGSAEITQADYNLVLAAVPSGTDTLLYVGTEDLYRCSVAAGCVLRNTTNAGNGCAYPAGVASAQHALAGLPGGLLYVGNDGGLWRSTDGVAETGGVCSPGDGVHFDNLNGGLGSLAEVVSFAQDPVDPGTLLAGLGALGSAGTGGGNAGAWTQLSLGEGGTVAIDQAAPNNWYAAVGAGITIGRCARGSACRAADFAGTVIDEAEVSNDDAEVHAPWMLDPVATGELLAGTCRMWRGPAQGGWTGADLVSAPFFSAAAKGCAATPPVVRSVAAAGALAGAGSKVLYAGMAGSLDGGATFGGHLLATFAADSAGAGTVWTDVSLGPVTNDLGNAGLFNPGGFDVSSVTVDPHDVSGMTVYATTMGFSGNGISEPHVYRSIDGGAHWLAVTANLPNAPANSLLVDPNDANTVYVALDTGVYVTTSITSCATASCWSVYGTALPNAPAMQLTAAPGMATGDGRTGELRVATYGRGIWGIPLLTASSPAVPLMTLSPQNLTFSSQQVGTESISVSIKVTNGGTKTLTVTSIASTGDFVETDTCVGAPVAVGTSCSIAVSFAPTATGARTGLLTVYGNVAGGQATAQLSGVGTAAASVVLTPLTLDFGMNTVGGQSMAQNVTISNTGGQTASLQAIGVSGDYAILANTCGATLASQTGCTVSVIFAPKSTGTRTGALTVTGSVGTQVANLTGIGMSPATDALSVSALSFGAQVIGSTSVPQQVLLLNAGDEALTLIQAQASGDFTVVNGCGASLVGHASCALTVAYVPKNLGIETGVLTVSDVFRTQTVALSGSGLAPAGVSVAPSGGLVFAATGVGLSATVQTVTLTNNGGVPLALSGVAATGDFAIFANTCGSVVSPGGVCTVGVSFAPSGVGTRTGALTFSDAAADGPQVEGLSGVGVDFSLAPDGPVSLTVASGQTATYLVLLNSVAGVPGSAVFTCAGLPAAATCTVSPESAPLGISGGTVLTVSVATGQTSAALRPPEMPRGERMAWLAFVLPVGVLAVRRRRLAGCLLACAFMLALGACSAARTIPGTGIVQTIAPVVTPSGTSSVVVAASSAGLVRGVTLTLVVQ